MHRTAFENAALFFEAYLPAPDGELVVDVGSQDVNGSLHEVVPDNVNYIGVDFIDGKGVDLVLSNPYTLPFADGEVDVCLCSSVFEHSEMFWVLFLEIFRTLAPGGLFYLNVPSNGAFHRYPVDCWRFYPDSGIALVNWAKYSGVSVAMLESFISVQQDDIWNDFVAVFVKDQAFANRYPNRILDTKTDFYNGRLFGSEVIKNHRTETEDWMRLLAIRGIVNGEIKVG